MEQALGVVVPSGIGVIEGGADAGVPTGASGVYVVTTSTPCEEVAKALVKNRKFLTLSAASKPAAHEVRDLRVGR